MAEKPNADQVKVQEARAAYVVERGPQSLPLAEELLRVVKELPEEKAQTVLDFARFLSWQQARARKPPAEEDLERLSLAEFMQRVHQRSAELVNVPREQLIAEFHQLREEIRREAIAKGVAIEDEEELIGD